MMERFEIVRERIVEIEQEALVHEPLLGFFKKEAAFLNTLEEVRKLVADGSIYRLELDELKKINKKLYEDILPDRYDTCYGNPDYVTSIFSEYDFDNEYVKCICFLYSELRGLIPYVFENNTEVITIFSELFVEVYGMFSYAQHDFDEDKTLNSDPEAEFKGGIGLPSCEELKKTIYWFESDNCDLLVPLRVRSQVDPTNDFATKIIVDNDLNDIRYLYYYGEFVTDNEIRIAEFLNSLPEEKIIAMASTYTEGYRIGFVRGNKDLSKKDTVNIRFRLGFERIVRASIEQFARMGLKPVIYRAATLSVNKKGLHQIGYYGAVANNQYDFDHRMDNGIYLDKDFVNRKLGVLKAAFEEVKTQANHHAGPACIETFGEEPFTPVSKKTSISLTETQQQLSADYSAQAYLITNKYIIGEERSFTIIAFPTPEIGKDFEKIFDETVMVNTLDYEEYQKIQQLLIDTLDTATRVHIKGRNGNRTDLYVALQELGNPEKETLFENCLADVNIPVGEVFTSPKLKGTNGVLHVTDIYLNELRYKDIELTFRDGCIAEYNCCNFESAEENRKYIKENLLFNHDYLPIGEFAIGTNTTAYAMARRYGIESRLPILIGEKTGPHFAVGDTCYSYEEDVKSYNPDGKEIVARENEISARRKTNPKEAYFSCHTDITIPYDQLDFICAIDKSGKETFIIKDGIFVLPGVTSLNTPLMM